MPAGGRHQAGPARSWHEAATGPLPGPAARPPWPVPWLDGLAAPPTAYVSPGGHRDLCLSFPSWRMGVSAASAPALLGEGSRGTAGFSLSGPEASSVLPPLPFTPTPGTGRRPWRRRRRSPRAHSCSRTCRRPASS